MKNIRSASTSHQPQATSGHIVIEIQAQRRNDGSTPRIDSPLSSLPPRPAGRRNSTGSDSGYETDNEANLSPYGGPRLHASLRGEESSSERFYDAEDSLEPSAPPSQEHAAQHGSQAHASASATGTARLSALAASVRAGATHGVTTLCRPTATAVAAATRGIIPISFDKQYLGAALGHLVHQTTSVGPTTFVRELIGEAMFAAFRHLPPEAVVAMQAVSGTLHLALHTLRRNRENRNPDAAARGFHNLNLEQWEALSEDERHHKRGEQQHYSDLVTRLALTGILSNIAIGAAGKAYGRPEMAARLLTSELKVAPYAAARDAIQATFRMVGTRAPTNGGVSDPHVTSAGRFYGIANILTNLASNELEAPDFASARQRWAGLLSPFNIGDATRIVFQQAAVNAALNVALETADWLSVTQHEADEAGTQQIWEPAWKAKREDYERIMDHSVARTAAINSNIAFGTAVNMIGTWLGLPPARSALLSNTLAGVAAGMQYKVIAGTWQAAAAVREAEAARAQTE
ncbi:hypothetical protein [Xanthomonas oryzae]|uniref:Uncharacterized protein n=1 Tax=Xanthomonas oryzae pv. oryzae TaxID=64187 RepID=A0AAJ5M929_XANOO|nr:hypothetical protein [Xanthomonas oryzae]OLI46173.1 hypothetical protein IXO141_00720 [Xanthomonas oryzae pv. oryzae]OLK01296.1 hypothetical protein IXO222_05235 [Xanthomonas oryzae pv. oryzae]OLK24647.1 hypothetical protein IXO621_03665 [Xanthomonas oryzae pv. oryzae]OLK46226.1 hypothetical protein IXO620_06845 [Xanthomonas oryzae pv. oryzae]QIE18242.1 hypothetical protein IXO704_000605 [Xanthomonas oryzae pv. oryzae]